jgi:hypothetical protein
MSVDPSIRERIMLAVMAHLATVDRPTDIPAPVRTRLVTPSAAQLPALTVYPGRDGVAPMHGPREGRVSRGSVVQRALEIKVEAVVAAVADGADALVDPLLSWATIAIIGMGRVDDGGVEIHALSNDPPDEVETKFSYEFQDFAYVRATLTILIEYQSLRTDPTQLG